MVAMFFIIVSEIRIAARWRKLAPFLSFNRHFLVSREFGGHFERAAGAWFEVHAEAIGAGRTNAKIANGGSVNTL
jgi:hypothetical protein